MFIEHLSKLLDNFVDAEVAFLSLGNVEFEWCPACFSELAEPKPGCCHLCGNEMSEEDRQAKALQVKLDIEGQIKESERIQQARLDDLTRLRSELRSHRNKFSRTLKLLEDFERAPVDGVTAQIGMLNREIGKIDARLDELERFGAIAQELHDLSEQKQDLNARMGRIKDYIASVESSKQKRRNAVMTNVRDNSIYFIEKDLSHHQDFDHLNDFSFSFEDDWFAVNGDPNISTSASGMVILKNCLMLGIMKSAVEDKKMLYPKFLIQDNGEDKGMVPERVRNFQKFMADWSDSCEEDHQIILTTSQIESTLNKQKYIVGRKYTKKDKTLNIQS